MRASFAASTSATVVVPLSPRFRFVVLLLSRCCLNALLRRNFPRLVRLKRLAAPRCVLIFCFGMLPRLWSGGSGLTWPTRPLCRTRRRLLGRSRLCLAAAALRPATQDRVHLIAFHPW